MSVSLIIEEINGKEVNEILPISGQNFFEKKWMPLCKLFDLKWVPLFKTGCSFNQSDLPFILEELLSLKNKCDYMCDKIDNEHLKIRLNELIIKLESLNGKNIIFFIG